MINLWKQRAKLVIELHPKQVTRHVLVVVNMKKTSESRLRDLILSDGAKHRSVVFILLKVRKAAVFLCKCSLKQVLKEKICMTGIK